MPNDDNASIRYLMKEMDPSEEVLMERSMMEDEDLLIEVECMRQTLKQLDENLPVMDPPAHVTSNVLRKASEHKPNNNSGFIPSLGGNRVGYVAAAAVVAAGLISGVLLYQDGLDGAGPNAQENTTSAAVSSSPSMEVDQPGVANAEMEAEPVDVRDVEPWVDRDEILRFQDQFGEQNQAEFDSILNTMTRKLKPIDDPLDMNSNTRSLQLTGSEQ
ncbi:hypothetical protein ACG2F4_05940 [Halalkalibaculum sp. DA3122]|uniref:hypothetical protein n=1 Tax=unclassified Halalkalibaculum TaxID=2964617 RepID=UPI00375419E3